MRQRATGMLVACSLLSLGAGAPADDDVAEPDFILKMATVAPDGSAWARESRAFARAVQTRTLGHVRVKWFFNGIAGDDLQQAQRIQRGQLDGVATAQMMTEQFVPSMRLGILPDLFQNREELHAVLGSFEPEFRADASKSGF
jgi:TRAP-type C4-dicarboxylate transport system substrate-binding protein